MNLKNRKKIKFVYIIIAIGLVTAVMLWKIGNGMLYHIENVIIKNIDKSIYDCIFLTFSNEELGNEELLNVIELNKNNDGQVVSVDYNFDIMYKHLSQGMELLYKNINTIELDGYERSKKNVYYLPSGLIYNNILLQNLGFKIPFRVEFIHDIDMGFKTKVRNYGINNLLVEVYITIDIKSSIMSPSSYEEFNNSYEIIVASKMVIGEIPVYIGDGIEKSGAILSS